MLCATSRVTNRCVKRATEHLNLREVFDPLRKSCLPGLHPLGRGSNPDPLMSDLSRARVSLTGPAEQLVGSVVMLFKHNAKLDPSLVEEAFADPELWPGTGDWLIVACRDDGTARYGIAPFASAAAVTNPREACAAIRRELQ
jgi:hypothetical protein